MKEIPYDLSKGVVRKLTGQCPGKDAIFKHSSSAEECILGFTALKNALAKVGIDIK